MRTEPKNKRVVVAMSGGVDSAVAAALLKKTGNEVIGITMCFNVAAADRKRPSCCGIDGIEDAKRIAAKLGIPHYVLNFKKTLQEEVIDNFCLEYLRGRTPNPCVRCNRYLKFDALLKKARQLDADYLATGHYARVSYDKRKGRYILRKGKDGLKEQSYFLYSIPEKALPYILMPLGDFHKQKIREIARNLHLPVADKPGSQEICFIDTDYRDFIRQQMRLNPRWRNHPSLQPGPIKDKQGNILGRHRGIAFYTIGQREGLGIALGHPAYIVKIDARTNSLVVGKKEDIFSKGLIARKINLPLKDYLSKSIEVKVKIRYNHREVKARLISLKSGRIKVIFKEPQRAVTPGQSVVFYRRDMVLGGGIICQEI